MSQMRDLSGTDANGPTNAPSIVFLHCTAATRKIWLLQVERLAGEFHVIAVDLPGHGAYAGTPFRLETAWRHVADVVNEAADGRALIVGLSLGGYVAMELAYHYPEQVAGLVLSGCRAGYTGAVGHGLRLGSLLLSILCSHRTLYNGFRWLVLSLLKRSIQTGRSGFGSATVMESIIAAGVYPQVVADVLRELAGKDFRPRLRAFAGPVLILNGERDIISRRAEVELAAAAKDARVDIIKQAGHAANLEQPEAFTSAIRRFATSVLHGRNQRQQCRYG